MLTELRELREAGFPQAFLNGYAVHRLNYSRLPLSERVRMDFGYYLRMKYIEYLRNGKDSVTKQ